MRLDILIDRLIEIQNSYNCDDMQISIMQESDASGVIVQYSSKVTEVVECVSFKQDKLPNLTKIVIVGREIL